MTVMEVVDDANVLGFMMFVQVLAHSHEVGRFPAPAAVIVEAELGAKLFGAVHQGQYRLCCSTHARLLCIGLGTGKCTPDLRVEFVFFKQGKGFLVGAPEGEEFKAMLLVLENFLFKLLYVLCAPIIGHALQTETLKHLGPLCRPALLGVKGHDAPRHKLFLGEIVSCFCVRRKKGQENNAAQEA